MTFVPNPNFKSDLQKMVQPVASQLVDNLRATLASFQTEYAGRDISVVRPALQEAWAATNEGAQISEPQLTLCAQAVSDRRRVWIDDRGHVMVESDK